LKPHLWLIRFIGVIVPRAVRADWLLEWEGELRHREALLLEWDRLDWHHKFDLVRRSTSAFLGRVMDAIIPKQQRVYSDPDCEEHYCEVQSQLMSWRRACPPLGGVLL